MGSLYNCARGLSTCLWGFNGSRQVVEEIECVYYYLYYKKSHVKCKHIVHPYGSGSTHGVPDILHSLALRWGIDLVLFPGLGIVTWSHSQARG